MHPYTSVILVAAGGSTRMGFDKIFKKIGNKTVIEYTIEAFEASSTTNEIIIVTTYVEQMREIVRMRGFKKVTCVCHGGADRQESVSDGVLRVSKYCDYISIHDGARPLISPSEIDDVHHKAFELGAAICGYEAVDTIKFVEDGRIISTPDRSSLFCAATPQVFERNLYQKALLEAKKNHKTYTDDAACVEASGVNVYTMRCGKENFKLTTPEDFNRLETVLAKRGLL